MININKSISIEDNHLMKLSITLCVENLTRPKEPVPSVTPTSKSSKLIGVGSVRTCGSLIVSTCVYF